MVKKLLILIMPVFFLLILQAYSDVYDYSILYDTDWYDMPSNCTVSSETPITYDGESAVCKAQDIISDNIYTISAIDVWYNSFFETTVNITYNSTIPILNTLHYGGCSNNTAAPASIVIYKVNGATKTLLGNWTNSQASTCDSLSGCISDSINWNYTFPNSITDVNKVSFEIHPKNCQFGAVNRYALSELRLLYRNGTYNSLPKVNITYNNTVLYLDNTSNAVFNFNINAVDPESDTIYYATNKENSYFIDKWITFDSSENAYTPEFDYILYCKILDRTGAWGLCTNFEKYGVSADFNNDSISTICPISGSITNSIEQNKTIFWSFDDKNYYKIGFNSSKSCGDNYLSIYNSDKKYNTSLYGLSFMVELTNESKVEIHSSYEDFYNILFPITLNRSNGVTDIYVNGSLIESNRNAKIEIKQLLNYDTMEYTLTTYNQSSYYFTLANNQFTYPIQSKKNPSLNIKGIEGTVYFDDIAFYSELTNFTWSTTKPTQTTFKKQGYYTYSIFVTDDAHKDYNEYSVYTIPITVLPKELNDGSYEGIQGTPLIIIPKKIFEPLLNQFGGKEIMQPVGWLAEFCVFFMLFFMWKWSFGSSFAYTAIIFVIFGLIGFTSVLQLAGNGVLLALAIMPYITQIFLPNFRKD